jgi:hypothetical protein
MFRWRDYSNKGHNRFLDLRLDEGGFFSSATNLNTSWDPDDEHREIVNANISLSKLA